MVRFHVHERIALPDAQHHLDLLAQLVRPRAIALVDHIQLGDLHHARFQRLDAVPGFRNEHEHRGLGRGGNVELRLPVPRPSR